MQTRTMHTLEQLRSGALYGTRRLDLSCGLHQLPPEVFDLADSLEVLNLSGNQLTSLPDDLPRLKKLKVVFCSDNPFTHFPEVLGACTGLQIVGFKANQIAHVPGAALPPALRWLILTDNQIEKLPCELGERPALQKLMLAGNQLRSLPESLAQAYKLELIRLAANQLPHLPGWLTQLPRLAWLALAGNPLGWAKRQTLPLAKLDWLQLQIGEKLGEGASGHVFLAQTSGVANSKLALKLFKGGVTSDGLPQHELDACLAAGNHPALCSPVAELQGHPDGTPGLLLPLIPPTHVNLAGPPSLESCTRDVYPSGLRMPFSVAFNIALAIAQALDHLHTRGVMHGDLYGHNIFWNPTTGDAVLSDFGAATLLPLGDAGLCKQLQALEVRAFGCLLEELLACTDIDANSTASASRMQVLARACLHATPGYRPGMADTAKSLRQCLLT
jgi:hypothetical protein